MKKALILLGIFVLLSCSAFALVADISYPKMILYKEVTPEQPTVFDNSIIVNNKNDFQVKIELEPQGDLEDIAVLEETEFMLEPGESKEVTYEITINKPKIYDGEIIARFTKVGATVGAGLAQTVKIVVTGEGDFSNVDDVSADVGDDTGDTAGDDITGDDKEDDSASAGDDGDKETTTTVEGEGIEKPKANPWIGALIFVVIVAIGLAIYFIIAKTGGKK